MSRRWFSAELETSFLNLTAGGHQMILMMTWLRLNLKMGEDPVKQ